MATLPWPAAPTALTVGVPSKLSLPRTLMVTGLSSVVLTLSLVMSTTALTVRLMTWVVALPSSSVTVTVKLSAPCQSATGV